jgi:hypothetical protein
MEPHHTALVSLKLDAMDTRVGCRPDKMLEVATETRRLGEAFEFLRVFEERIEVRLGVHDHWLGTDGTWLVPAMSIVVAGFLADSVRTVSEEGSTVSVAAS